MLSNLQFIKEKGIEKFIGQQEKRIGLLETMIKGYDDGRSRSFFCRAAALLDVKTLEGSLDETKKVTGAGGRTRDTVVEKARVLRGILGEAAVSEGIELARKR